MQALASRRDCSATATPTVTTVLMRTAKQRPRNSALHQSSTRMSKAGQQDTGEAALVRTVHGVKRIAEGHQLDGSPPGSTFWVRIHE